MRFKRTGKLVQNLLEDDRLMFLTAEVGVACTAVWSIAGAVFDGWGSTPAFVLLFLATFVAFESQVSMARSKPGLQKSRIAGEVYRILACAAVTFVIAATAVIGCLLVWYPDGFRNLMIFLLVPSVMAPLLALTYLVRTWVFWRFRRDNNL